MFGGITMSQMADCIIVGYVIMKAFESSYCIAILMYYQIKDGK